MASCSSLVPIVETESRASFDYASLRSGCSSLVPIVETESASKYDDGALGWRKLQFTRSDCGN